jgi:nitrile hydratase
MVREPRKVLEEFKLRIGKNVQLRVHDSTADMRYMVLPMRPAGTQGWSEKRLAALVTRDSMIGVALPKPAPGASRK